MKNYNLFSNSILTLLIFFMLFASDIAIASIVKVAAVQYSAIPFNKIENIKNLKELIIKAANNGAKIIVLPEMSTTGLSIMGPEQARNLAETIPGPTTNEFAKVAKQYSVYIVLGLPEVCLKTNKYYNSQIIIDDSGCILKKYRKIHLYESDYNWASEGNLGYQVVETDLGKIGLGICYDINFPDILDFFSQQDVDILAYSANWVSNAQPLSYWVNTLKGRKFNLIAANNWGHEKDVYFSGGSLILSSDSNILAKDCTPSNVILFADVKVRNKTKKILLTGFEPFDGYAVNSSWEAIKVFDNQSIKNYSIKSVVLPVEYNKSVNRLLKVVDSYDPDIVISFGLASGDNIRLEKFAKNNVGRHADNIGQVPESKYILLNSPLIYNSRLPLEKIYKGLSDIGIKVDYSSDAGSYVCNYLFYSLMAFTDKGRIRNFLGFIHLPPLSNDFTLDKLTQSIKVILDVVIDHDLEQKKNQNIQSAHHGAQQK